MPYSLTSPSSESAQVNALRSVDGVRSTVASAVRFRSIDAARGAAMVLVCLSHFAAKYIAPAGGDAPGGWLRLVAHTASPMFFIISGAMVGYLATSRPESFDRVRSELGKRALFFLTVGHLLILGAHLRSLGDIAHPERLLFVTDTIALALLLSPRVLGIRPGFRLAGAAAAFGLSSVLVYAWDPEGVVWRVVKDTLVGPEGPGFWVYNVPIVPWLAVHAAGTVLGALLADATSRAARLRFEATLVTAGGVLVAGAGAVRGMYWLLAHGILAAGSPLLEIARQSASPWSRLPPSPAHMLLFSGMALLAIAAVFAADRRQLFSALSEWLAVLGRTSAFVFVLQFYVFYVLVPKLVPLRLELAPVVFLLVMLGIGQVAKMWLHGTWKIDWHWGAAAKRSA